MDRKELPLLGDALLAAEGRRLGARLLREDDRNVLSEVEELGSSALDSAFTSGSDLTDFRVLPGASRRSPRSAAAGRCDRAPRGSSDHAGARRAWRARSLVGSRTVDTRLDSSLPPLEDPRPRKGGEVLWTRSCTRVSVSVSIATELLSSLATPLVRMRFLSHRSCACKDAQSVSRHGDASLLQRLRDSFRALAWPRLRWKLLWIAKECISEPIASSCVLINEVESLFVGILRILAMIRSGGPDRDPIEAITSRVEIDCFGVRLARKIDGRLRQGGTAPGRVERTSTEK